MSEHDPLFRRRAVVGASSLGVIAACRIVRAIGDFDEDSVVGLVENFATLPMGWAAVTSAALGTALLVERNDAHFERQGRAEVVHSIK